MEIVRLNEEQVAALYPCMEEAFPPDELKPLSRILDALRRDAYDCLGLMAQDELLGYAFFVRTGYNVLLDYLSVLPAYRNRGIGAAFLNLLSAYCQAADSVLAEVEDPAYAETPQERQLMERRLGFYQRNGFRNTGVGVLVFGVRYLLLTCNDRYALEQVKETYRAHYRAMLPQAMFRRFIQV